MMTKQDAYSWLANMIDAPLSHAHIGYLGEYYCKQVITQCKEYLERYKKNPQRIELLKGGAVAS